MANIPAGSYLASDPAFAPDASGACSPETLSKVAELAQQSPWPDRSQEVAAFAIDKHVVSCRDYSACVRAGACTESRDTVCVAHAERVTLDEAVAYCRWRDAKLPTLLQWQAAVRGPAGKASGECDQKSSTSSCIVTSERGVQVSVASGPKLEFTSTLMCWPAKAGEPGGAFPLTIALFVNQLNVFAPSTPGPEGTVDTAWFRCARNHVTALPR